MNVKLSKALTGAAWVLVGVGALKQVWRTSPQPTHKKAPLPDDKGSEPKESTAASNHPDSSASH